MRRVSLEIRPPDPELMVDDRRVDEDEELLAARRAASIDELERLLGQALGQLARIGDRRRRAEKHRIRPVVPADPPQPPQHVAEMAAEDAAIGVQLVDDHVAQVLEQLRPPRMVRQDARVHHVRIAEHEVRARADRPPRVLRRVAVVREDADLRRPTLAAMRFAHRLQLGELILRERLRRKQIQRAAGRILQNRVQDRRVVAERLARRRRRDHDHVAAGRARVRSPRPDACRAVRCRAPEAPLTSRRSSAAGNGAYCAATAGSRRTAVTCRSGVSGRSSVRSGARRSRAASRAPSFDPAVRTVQDPRSPPISLQ